MNTRPRDICTAAFHGDTARLRQLLVAAGLYTSRWQPPCHIDTSPMTRAAIEEDIANDDATEAAAAPAPLVSEDVSEEMTEVMSEEEMTALLAHPELKRVTRAYALERAAVDEGGDEEETEEGRGLAAAAAVEMEEGEGWADDAELFDEAEEEAAEADRQAQQNDLLAFRCLLAEQRHRESVAGRLKQHGFVLASTTPPVNMTPYGILFSCRERAVERKRGSSNDSADALSSIPHAAADKRWGDNATSAGEAGHDELAGSAVTSLQVRWQPSKRSRYAGTPLHWAVLAREHAMVKFLIEHGADPTAGLKLIGEGSNLTSRADTSKLPLTPHNGVNGEQSSTTCDDSINGALNAEESTPASKVLEQLTPAAMATANESLPTLQILEDALTARTAEAENRARFLAALEGRLQRRKERYVRRRQIAVARRALQAEAQRAEDEAAAAAEEEENENGDGDGYDEGEEEAGDDAN